MLFWLRWLSVLRRLSECGQVLVDSRVGALAVSVMGLVLGLVESALGVLSSLVNSAFISIIEVLGERLVFLLNFWSDFSNLIIIIILKVLFNLLTRR